MKRVDIEAVGRGDFDDLAEVHHRDPVRDVADDGEIVRDEEVGQPELALELLHEVDDLRLDGDVERRDRLVADEKLRVQRERSCNTDALSLAAGELMRVATDRVRRQADEGEQLAHASPGLRTTGDGVDAKRFSDDTADRMPRVQRSERILEDHLHSSPERSQRTLLQVRDVLPIEDDPAGGRFVQSKDRSAESRLATAGLADEAERLALIDRQRHVVDRLDVADVAIEDDPARDREVHLERIDFEKWTHGAPGSKRAKLTQLPPAVAAIRRRAPG